MSVKVNDGEVLVRFDDGGTIEVREWFAGDAFTGRSQPKFDWLSAITPSDAPVWDRYPG
jgi:hypothetical protein